MRELFENPSKTYKTRANAKKVIDALDDGDFSWSIGVTEEGRFFPIVYIDTSKLNFHYFINRGCCVKAH